MTEEHPRPYPSPVPVPDAESGRAAGAFDVVVASSTGERLVRHAQAFVDALRALGQDASLAVDRPPDDESTPLLLAPSTTLRGLAETGHRDHAWIGRAACLSLARPFTRELSEDAAILADAAAPFLAVKGSARLVGARTPRAVHLPFGYHPTVAAWTPTPVGANETRRPVDVAFFGHGGGERQQLLARLADALDPYVADLRISRLGEPIGVDQPPWLANSDVLLVLSDGEPSAGDWLDLVDAASNGAVPLVVDPGDLDPFEPGVHVMASTARSVAASLPRVLADRTVLGEMRVRARALVEGSCSTMTAARTIARSTPRSNPPGRSPTGAHAPAVSVTDAPPRAPEIATPQPPAARLWPRESGDPYDQMTPDVSVLIPVFNGAGHVADAVRSAASAQGVRVEVIVVDDCSTDETVDIVRSLVPRLPILLVRREVNGGVAAARNDGMAWVRAPLVFLLDADNRLLPHGVARLRAALDTDESAWFSYGIHVAMVDEEPTALRNTEPWSPGLFRNGNYIDNAALLRRSTWERIGGFNETQTAWEDYDRWLRVAALGGHGAYAPCIVMRYAVRPGSLSDRLGLDEQAELRRLFAVRYPEVLRSAR
jgi:hypothetical protein